MIDAMHPKMVTKIPMLGISRFFFANTWMAWLWLIVRLYVGYQWLTAGWSKLTGYSIELTSFGKATGSPPWVFSHDDGASVTAFLQKAITSPDVQPWYAAFLRDFILPHSMWCAYIVTFGEILVGLGLIFGCLTGIAAFFGLFMSLNFLMAGTISTNVILAILSLLLVLAWRVAGYYGIDQQLIPMIWSRRLREIYHQENMPMNASPATPTGRTLPSLKMDDARLEAVRQTQMNEAQSEAQTPPSNTNYMIKPDK